MPITPAQAFAMTADEEETLTLWEGRIDQALRNQCSFTDYAFVQLDRTATNRVREELTRRYTDAGWTVTYHDDQRDGESLTFRPARPV